MKTINPFLQACHQLDVFLPRAVRYVVVSPDRCLRSSELARHRHTCLPQLYFAKQTNQSNRLVYSCNIQ